MAYALINDPWIMIGSLRSLIVIILRDDALMSHRDEPLMSVRTEIRMAYDWKAYFFGAARTSEAVLYTPYRY